MIPERKLEINLCGVKRPVSFPKLLWVFSDRLSYAPGPTSTFDFGSGQRGACALYYVAEKKKEIRLASFNLGNVFDNGKVCWGDNRYPVDLREAEHTFFSSPFNFDLTEPEVIDAVNIPLSQKTYNAVDVLSNIATDFEDPIVGIEVVLRLDLLINRFVNGEVGAPLKATWVDLLKTTKKKIEEEADPDYPIFDALGQVLRLKLTAKNPAINAVIEVASLLQLIGELIEEELERIRSVVKGLVRNEDEEDETNQDLWVIESRLRFSPRSYYCFNILRSRKWGLGPIAESCWAKEGREFFQEAIRKEFKVVEHLKPPVLESVHSIKKELLEECADWSYDLFENFHNDGDFVAVPKGNSCFAVSNASVKTFKALGLDTDLVSAQKKLVGSVIIPGKWDQVRQAHVYEFGGKQLVCSSENNLVFI